MLTKLTETILEKNVELKVRKTNATSFISVNQPELDYFYPEHLGRSHSYGQSKHSLCRSSKLEAHLIANY